MKIYIFLLLGVWLLISAYAFYLRTYVAPSLPEDEMPAKLNNLWNRADNENDILGYFGFRSKTTV